MDEERQGKNKNGSRIRTRRSRASDMRVTLSITRGGGGEGGALGGWAKMNETKSQIGTAAMK